MASIHEEVKKKLGQLYPQQEGWSIREVRVPNSFPAPDFLIAKGKHIVLVGVKEEDPVTHDDLVKLDKLREMFLAISAVIYYGNRRQVNSLVEKEADRLGISLIAIS